MSVSPEALAFLRQLSDDRAARSAQLGCGMDSLDAGTSPEDIFTEQITDILSEVGALGAVSLCRLDRRHGSALVKVNAYEVDEDEGRLDLVLTRFHGSTEPQIVPRAEVERIARSGLRFVALSRRDLASHLRDDGPVYDMVQRVSEARFDTIRLTLITDGVARELEDQRGLRTAAGPFSVELHVWDIERVARSVASGRARELIELDLEQSLGGIL